MTTRFADPDVEAVNTTCWKIIESLDKPLADRLKIDGAVLTDEFRFIVNALIDAADSGSNALLAYQLRWTRDAFKARGFSTEDFNLFLLTIEQAVADACPGGDALHLGALLRTTRANLDAATPSISAKADHGSPFDAECEAYTSALLSARRIEARNIVTSLLETGVPLLHVYVYIFQRSQQKIGQLWQQNKLSITQEHYCTASTQFIMSQLYGRVFETKKNGYRALVAALGNELHEVGPRMVCDCLELCGWDTEYLGTTSSPEEIIEAAREHHPAVIGLSVTLSVNVRHVRHANEMIRNAKLRESPRIMVGGLPFTIDPQLVSSVRADGYAADLLSVSDEALRLVS